MTMNKSNPMPSHAEIQMAMQMQAEQQKNAEIAMWRNEWRGIAGAIFKELAVQHIKNDAPDKDEEVFEKLAIRCAIAGRAFHMAFGVYHGDDPDEQIAKCKKKLAEQAAKAKPGKVVKDG